MIIGINENFDVNKNIVSKYLKDKYSYKYLNVDQILLRVLKEHIYGSDMEKHLQIRNMIDVEINNYISSLDSSDNLIISYSLLESSFIFEYCDILINVLPKTLNDLNADIDLLIRYRNNNMNGNSKYHLCLNLEEDWQEKLTNYIDYNVYNNTKVTVVVPIYNTIDYISRCVNSITAQTYRNLEILLIDDGSTDESLKICNILAKKDERIKVVHQQNVGLAETRNIGMELATGEYICFFDSDDYVDNSMIETLLKTIKKTGADVCEGSFYIHLKNGNIKDVSCEQKGVKFVHSKLSLINAYSDATILIPAWDKLYKLSSIKNIKFDKNCFKEDSDYIFRLCMAEKTFALVPIPFYHYVKRKSVSLTGNKISPRLFTLQNWGGERLTKKYYHKVKNTKMQLKRYCITVWSIY